MLVTEKSLCNFPTDTFNWLWFLVKCIALYRLNISLLDITRSKKFVNSNLCIFFQFFLSGLFSSDSPATTLS